MELIQQRRKSEGNATASELFIAGVRECFTLEDVVREDPDKSTPENEAKVFGETAIPALRYVVSLEKSTRFGDDTITLRWRDPRDGVLKEVPGYQYIRVHGGNKPEDTEGCVLVGTVLTMTEHGPRIMGGTSQPALKALKAKIKEALAANEEVFWEIREAA